MEIERDKSWNVWSHDKYGRVILTIHICRQECRVSSHQVFAFPPCLSPAGFPSVLHRFLLARPPLWEDAVRPGPVGCRLHHRLSGARAAAFRLRCRLCALAFVFARAPHRRRRVCFSLSCRAIYRRIRRPTGIYRRDSLGKQISASNRAPQWGHPLGSLFYCFSPVLASECLDVIKVMARATCRFLPRRAPRWRQIYSAEVVFRWGHPSSWAESEMK